MKKLSCLFLAFLFLLSCTACTDWDELSNDPLQELSQYYQSENDSQTAPEIYSFTLPYYDSETLDGVTCRDGFQQVLGKLLYECLYEPDPAFDPQPVLAESSRYDAETLTYTIRLRSNIRFSDSSPLTAQDVADTLLRAAESARYGSRFDQVDTITAADQEVIITLLTPNGGFLSLLDIPIVKSGTESQKIPLGTGPYAVAKEDNKNYLAPNQYWWQNKRLPLSRIELLPCKSSDAANYAFTAQNIQLICSDLIGTDPISVDFSGDCTDAPDTALHYLGFNLRNELLVNSNVRRAIGCAIDRGSLVATYLLGHAVQTQFPLSPASDAYPRELEQPYSRDTLDSAMEKAGLHRGGEKTELTLVVNEENRFKVAAASEIARVLNQYDLAVTVQALPWEDYYNALVYGQYDLYYGETKLRADWDFSALIASDGRLNFGGFFDPATDTLLQCYLAAQGQARLSALHDLCLDFQEKQPIVPICFKSVSVLVTKGAVEHITPTAGNPFYQLENWTVNLSES